MLEVLFLLLILVSAIQALRSRDLLTSALWLGGTSASTALLLQRAGAEEIAVLELSIGAGLVTVLFVFAITLTGESAVSRMPIPRRIAATLVLVTLIVFVVHTMPETEPASPVITVSRLPLKTVLWEERQADLLLQVVLMFASALGVSGLLVETGKSAIKRHERIPETNQVEKKASSIVQVVRKG